MKETENPQEREGPDICATFVCDAKATAQPDCFRKVRSRLLDVIGVSQMAFSGCHVAIFAMLSIDWERINQTPFKRMKSWLYRVQLIWIYCSKAASTG